MRRLAIALTIVGGVTFGAAAPAFAGGTCYPPPPQCEWRPGFGGLGAVHSAQANAFGVPGDGAGDQNHCHSGPPGQGLPRFD